MKFLCPPNHRFLTFSFDAKVSGAFFCFLNFLYFFDVRFLKVASRKRGAESAVGLGHGRRVCVHSLRKVACCCSLRVTMETGPAGPLSSFTRDVKPCCSRGARTRPNGQRETPGDARARPEALVLLAADARRPRRPLTSGDARPGPARSTDRAPGSPVRGREARARRVCFSPSECVPASGREQVGVRTTWSLASRVEGNQSICAAGFSWMTAVRRRSRWASRTDGVPAGLPGPGGGGVRGEGVSRPSGKGGTVSQGRVQGSWSR